MLARMIEEDDVTVRVAKPGLPPHPRLVTRTMLEGNSGSRQFLDPFIKVVALEVDSGRGEYPFVGIYLDRESHAARRFEPRISSVGAVDDLGEANPAVEVDRALIVGAGDGHLVEPWACADVEAYAGLAHRPAALP